MNNALNISRVSFSKPAEKRKIPTPKPLWEGNLEIAASLIRNHQTFLFSADIDPDSVGSMLSIALYLQLLDKKVFLIISQDLPKNLDYLSRIIEYNSISVLRDAEDITRHQKEIEAVIFCDTANTKLVPFFPLIQETFLSRGLPVIEFDHHFGADSEQIWKTGVHLFKKANSTTEITGEFLKKLYQKYSSGPNPFLRRNILISLLTGLLGDTDGGRVVPFRESYDYWIAVLGDYLETNTRWRSSSGSRPGDDPKTKFGQPEQIFHYLNRLSREQEICLQELQERIVIKGNVWTLNLLNSSKDRYLNARRPYDSPWFANILGYLLSQFPTDTAKVGLLYYHGKNAEDKECIYIKMRRSARHPEIDLRKTEDQIRAVFDGKYMGGGGHPGAVSFRVHPHEEQEFLTKFESVIDSLKSKLTD